MLSPERIVIWDADANAPALAEAEDQNPAMTGSFTVELPEGPVSCYPAWEDLVARVAEYDPETVEGICGLRAEDIQYVARTRCTAALRRPWS